MSQNAEDNEFIRETVLKYVNGVKNNDTALITEAFHAEAAMSVYLPEFQIVPKAASFLIDFLNSSPPTAETSPDFTAEIISIEQSGEMAAVLLREYKLAGANFLTSFQMHKVNAQWVITSKATHPEPL